MVIRNLSLVISSVIFISGCNGTREDLDYDFEVEQTWVSDDGGRVTVQFVSVPYQPMNTALLRSEIAAAQRVDSRRVLELGGGTGFFAIGCAAEGAKQVVVLADNRAIHACVRYNVAVAEQDSVVEARLIEPNAEAVLSAITAAERFDYVVVNTETTLDESLVLAAIEQLPKWLRGGGKGWVICESPQMKAVVTTACKTLGFQVLTMRSSDQSLVLDPDAFPQTLQIDPFAAVKTEAAATSEVRECANARPSVYSVEGWPDRLNNASGSRTDRSARL